MDVPQQQLRAKILTADPVPIWNARPEPFTFTGYGYQESNIMCQPTPLGAAPTKYPNMSGLVMAMPGGATFMLMPDNPDGSAPPYVPPAPSPAPVVSGDINLSLDYNEQGNSLFR